MSGFAESGVRRRRLYETHRLKPLRRFTPESHARTPNTTRATKYLQSVTAPRRAGTAALDRRLPVTDCHTHTVRGRHCLRPGFRSRGCGLSADLPAPATAVLMLPSTSVVLRLSNRQVRRRPDWLVSSQRAEAATDTTEAGASILTISDGGITWHARMIPLESKDTLGVGGITTRAGREPPHALHRQAASAHGLEWHAPCRVSRDTSWVPHVG